MYYLCKRVIIRDSGAKVTHVPVILHVEYECEFNKSTDHGSLLVLTIDTNTFSPKSFNERRARGKKSLHCRTYRISEWGHESNLRTIRFMCKQNAIHV